MNNEVILIPEEMDFEDGSGIQWLSLSSSSRVLLQEAVDPTNLLYASNEYSNRPWTNNFSKQRTPFLFEPALLDRVVKRNDKIWKVAVESAIQRLMERLHFYNYDDDSEALFWPVVDKIIAETSIPVLGAALQKITTRYNDYPNVLCAVAKCLCSFELEETAEWGPMLLIALLAHKNESVKEYAVFLLDNWKDQSLLPILRNLDCQTTWLKEYINSVVVSLEG